MLAFAPVAALYEWTPLPFALANWMLVVSCLIYAHMGLFLLWQAIHDDWDASPLVRWGICLLVAVPILRFALDGFYDVVMTHGLFLLLGRELVVPRRVVEGGLERVDVQLLCDGGAETREV